MFVNNSFFRKKLRGGAWLLFNALENNGNCNMHRNGEVVFLKNFLAHVGSQSSVTVFDVGANVGDYSNLVHDLSAFSGGRGIYHSTSSNRPNRATTRWCNAFTTITSVLITLAYPILAGRLQYSTTLKKAVWLLCISGILHIIH